jgi:hypothetical protein
MKKSTIFEKEYIKKQKKGRKKIKNAMKNRKNFQKY